MESLLEGCAEFFSAELSEKVKRGLAENVLKCKWNGGGMPIGYCVDNEQFFRIDPATFPLVLETLKRYAEGDTIIKLLECHKMKVATTDVDDAVMSIVKIQAGLVLDTEGVSDLQKASNGDGQLAEYDKQIYRVPFAISSFCSKEVRLRLWKL